MAADGFAWTAVGLAITSIFVLTLMFLASRYRRCPSDKILVIFGAGPGMQGQAVKCLHGGGALIYPLIQNYAFLDLKPMTFNINLTNALSYQNIRTNVSSTFTIGVATDPKLMQNAAERLLHLTPAQIEDMAKEIIFGQLRLTVATLTIEQINQDHELFLEAIVKNVDHELVKIGLHLINVNVTDIREEVESERDKAREYHITVFLDVLEVAWRGGDEQAMLTALAASLGIDEKVALEVQADWIGEHS